MGHAMEKYCAVKDGLPESRRANPRRCDCRNSCISPPDARGVGMPDRIRPFVPARRQGAFQANLKIVVKARDAGNKPGSTPVPPEPPDGTEGPLPTQDSNLQPLK